MHQFELAGCLTERTYEESIPPECAMTTLALHQESMLCWGLVRAIEKGHKMDCTGCDETKEAHRERIIRINQRKAERAALAK